MVCRCNPEQTKELQKQIYELINKSYVRESHSPCVDVSDELQGYVCGTWRMCVDSRAVNNITLKYRFSIPRCDVVSDELQGSVVFLKIDL